MGEMRRSQLLDPLRELSIAEHSTAPRQRLRARTSCAHQSARMAVRTGAAARFQGPADLEGLFGTRGIQLLFKPGTELCCAVPGRAIVYSLYEPGSEAPCRRVSAIDLVTGCWAASRL